MGFGEYDGALDSAKKGIRKFAGCRSLLPGELSRDGLKFFREVVRDRLEHARDGFLHAGIRLRELLREDTQKAPATPKLRRALLQMLEKGKRLFNRIRDPDMRSVRQYLRACPQRPLQNREAQLLLRIKKIIKASFGQRGLLANRIHSRGCIATGQEQFFRCGQETLFGLIGGHFNRTCIPTG